MLKKIADLTEKDHESISSSAYEIITHEKNTYRVDVIASNTPLVKGQNPFFSSLQIFKDEEYNLPDAIPVYREVFKETITPKQIEEAINSIRKFPNTYLPHDEKKEN